MDTDIIQSLTAQLTDKPMFLLDIPESIFELFESDKLTGNECHASVTGNSSSTDSSAFSSLCCSKDCSRCESLASPGDVANLQDLYEDEDMVNRMIEELGAGATNTELQSSRFILDESTFFMKYVTHQVFPTFQPLMMSTTMKMHILQHSLCPKTLILRPKFLPQKSF